MLSHTSIPSPGRKGGWSSIELRLSERPAAIDGREKYRSVTCIS
jgi:hypothetical protein